MTNTWKLLILGLCLSLATAAGGQPGAGRAANELSTCLTESLNGKERKLLARWIFFAMAVHPDFDEYSSITETQRQGTDKAIGELITRLIAEDCPAKAQAAREQGGSMAFRVAFEATGRVAMQELMSNRAVMASMGSFEQYLDKEKMRESAEQTEPSE